MISSSSGVQARTGVVEVAERGRLVTVLREVGEVVARELDRLGVVLGDVVRRAGDLDAHAPTAELLRPDLLARGGEHEIGAAGEERGLLRHHDEVGHRRGERAVTGRHTEHQAHHRHLTLEVGHRLEVVRRARRRGGAGAHAGAGALLHPHHRHALLAGELGDAVPLVRTARAHRTGLDGEVLGTDRGGATVHEAEPAHEPVGGQVALVADQGAELVEGARVEQRGDPLPHVELAGAVVLLQPLGPAHLVGPGPGGGQPLQPRFPVGDVPRPLLGRCLARVDAMPSSARLAVSRRRRRRGARLRARAAR